MQRLSYQVCLLLLPCLTITSDKTPMFLLFREVPYWVSWFNFSWQLSLMQPLAHQDICCQCPSRLFPLLVSLLPSARFSCAFLKVASLTHGNVGTQVAEMRNGRSQGHLGLAPIGTKIKWSKEQSAGIAAAALASVHWPVTGSLPCYGVTDHLGGKWIRWVLGTTQQN